MMLPRRHILVLAALLLVPCFAAGDVAGYGITIQRAELLRDESGKGYSLDANIDYRFSEPAIDALRNGVSLGMVLRIRVKPESGWWWSGTAHDERLPFRISYHSLSKLYQIIYENNESPRNFVSFNALLENLGTVRGMLVLASASLVPGGRYTASLSVGLDIESLPLPLRPVAYVTPAWHLSSTPYQWTFVN